MPFWFELIVSLLLLGGGTFILLGSLGLVRMPDFYTRMHAPTKATTLGMWGLLIGALLLSSWNSGVLSMNQLLIAVFLLLTTPVSTHMLAKSALHHRLEWEENTQGQEHAKRFMDDH
ncbi:Na+/H+ antiporter subunit G [Marinobacterium aestuarii]|uniref:Na+/H+ antiporter subunit G n=1 Tax=Marinobacterium aestuarii TaxID=1821621 RepID=A0A1A9EUC1_9GAMM|nr:Na+/H+ antiporter subunit G [Marinobacterium aestuarii]ANG61133.1 Na+/H+ antiporter subunit G [Marinobacterium aestuarii]